MPDRTLLKSGKAKVSYFDVISLGLRSSESGATKWFREEIDLNLLKTIYEKVTVVRNCIELIANVIRGTRWYIIGKDPGKVRALEEFFFNLNENNETMSEFLYRLTRNLLLYDVCFIEKVKNIGGNLAELWIRDPIDFQIEVDEHGVIHKYYQREVEFNKDEIIYMVLHPQESGVWGKPILVTLIKEIIAALNSSDLSKVIFSSKSFPFGILVLPNLESQQALTLLEEKFKTTDKYSLHILAGSQAEDAEWIPFKSSESEIEKLTELTEWIEEKIYKAFGITQLDFGYSEGVGREVAEISLRISHNRTIQPILNLIQSKLNKEVVIPFAGEGYELKFLATPAYDPSFTGRLLTDWLRMGIISINEARGLISEMTGYRLSEVRGGDQHKIILGNLVEDVNKEEEAGENVSNS